MPGSSQMKDNLTFLMGAEEIIPTSTASNPDNWYPLNNINLEIIAFLMIGLI